MKETFCESCKGNNVNGVFYYYDIEQVIIHAFEKKNLRQLIDQERELSQKVLDDEIVDFTSAQKYKHWSTTVLKNIYDLCLLWNYDGVSVSKSSKGQIVPLQIQILNVLLKTGEIINSCVDYGIPERENPISTRI